MNHSNAIRSREPKPSINAALGYANLIVAHFLDLANAIRSTTAATKASNSPDSFRTVAKYPMPGL
jgi:hypothetical protein